MIKKVRFIEPGNYAPYKKSIKNYFIYNKTIRNPSTGLMSLATIVKKRIEDCLMYSESISFIDFDDIYDSDIVFISINTYNANRGYKIANLIRENSESIIVFGGMHASLNYTETINYCDYILTGDGDESIIDIINAIDKNSDIDFPGVVYYRDNKIVNTGKRNQPENIDIIPDRYLVYKYSEMAKKYDTIWPQVHASRGCPHYCAYCAVIEHFGRKIRKRSPDNVIEDIQQAIEFHKRKPIPRFNKTLWITDDNFTHDRIWAIEVLNKIINSGIKYSFTVQARYEIGFDDELLQLMKKAGFLEVALGIEFVKDDNFKKYNKKSTSSGIIKAIKNIQKHGIGVRGLFIVGADDDKKGVGEQIVKFVEDNKIHGVLIQSLFFTPGTDFYNSYKDKLIHENWDKYDGNVVHYPGNMSPHEVQEEIIYASRKIYSFRKLIKFIFTAKWLYKVLFIGEYFWHKNIRSELKKDLPYLKNLKR